MRGVASKRKELQTDSSVKWCFFIFSIFFGQRCVCATRGIRALAKANI